MRVLLATDGSESSLRAAEELGRLLRSRPDVRVTLLSVAEAPEAHHGSEDGAVGYSISEAMRSARTCLRQAEQALGGLAGTVIGEVAVGNPAEEIITHARLEEVDLIVIGRRGRSALPGLAMGGVSHKVVHLAQCPVMLIG